MGIINEVKRPKKWTMVAVRPSTREKIRRGAERDGLKMYEYLEGLVAIDTDVI